MKPLVRSGLRAGLKSWPTLLLFEITYKMAGYILFNNLIDFMKEAMLKLLGIQVIGQQDMGAVFRNPLCILMILGAFLLFACYIYLEIIALVLYCEAGWRGRGISIWELWKSSLLRLLPLFRRQNLPILLVLAPVIGLSVLPLTGGFIGKLRLPEFIFDYIKDAPVLFAAFLAVMLLLNVLLFFYLFAFPAIILVGRRYRGSLRESIRLLKGKKIKTLCVLLVCMLAFLLAVLLLFAGMILILWIWSRLASTADGGRSLFQFHYLKWSPMGRILLSTLGAVSLFSAVISLYHHYCGEERPEPEPVGRKLRPVLASGAAVILTLLVLAFFSETELGGNAYTAPSSGTQIVAHRAGAAFAPENTLAALRQSIKSGADVAEIDVQQTKDGVLIIMHDSNFLRTAGLGQKVWNTDYDTVKTLDAGSSFSAEFKGEPIPTLKEMLELAKGNIKLMIELKATGHEHGLVEQTIAQIMDAGMQDQCVIASMDPSLLKKSKEIAPRIETAYITMLAVSERYDLAYVDGYSVETGFLTAEMVTEAHYEHKKVYAWTANSDNNIMKIIRLGTDGLVTDNPLLADFILNVTNQNYFLNTLTELLYPE